MTGETVVHAVVRLDIASAQRGLAEPNASVTSVAREAGFGTSQSFAQAFRGVAGMSPTEFCQTAPHGSPSRRPRKPFCELSFVNAVSW